LNRYLKIFLAVLLSAVAVAGLLKTDHIRRMHGFTDMRNRVVGARLMKDGKLPYYHHWYPGDTLRYMVERMADTGRHRHVNMITASPLFHRILALVADYEEATLERAVYFICYGLFFFLAVWAACKSRSLLWTLALFVPFLFTDAWWHHILQTQSYLIFGFLLFLSALCLYRKQELAAGLVLAFVILLRLNCIVFLLPFFLDFRRYRRFILATLAGIGVYVVIVACLPFERANWMEYFSAIKEHTAVHIGQIPNAPESLDMNRILPRVFEGYNLMEMDSVRKAEHFYVNPSAVNFKGVYARIAGHRPLSYRLCQALFALSVAAVFFFLFRKRRHARAVLRPQTLVYTGFLFYFLSNFFSPIDNPPYQMAQWIVAASLFLADRHNLPRAVLWLMLAGILVNIFYVPVFPFKHMASECLFMAATLTAIFGRGNSIPGPLPDPRQACKRC